MGIRAEASYVWLTYSEVYKRILAMGSGLMNAGTLILFLAGLKPGDSVLLIGDVCLAYYLVDLASLSFGFLSAVLEPTVSQ